jgi:hypothetical protein
MSAGFGEKVAEVFSQATRPQPPAAPMGTLWVPERMACRPVSRADRVGVHCDSRQ